MKDWKTSQRVGVGTIWAVALTVLVGMTTVEQGVPQVGIDSAAAAEVSFENDVLPILQQWCVECHGGLDDAGEKVLEEGLDVSTYEGLMAGSTWGTVVEAGDAEASMVVEMMVNGDMPKDAEEAMPAEEIEVISQWIAEGANNN